MTRITKIKTEGLRATDREVELAPLTLIRGRVGSGKTNVCDALRIGALGYVPELGKNSQKTQRMMRNGELRVALELDDGAHFERGYRREGESLKGFAAASWMPAKAKLTEIEESIRTYFGRDDREAAEHLDLRELLNCSPDKRARRIEKMLDASGIPTDELKKRATAMMTLRLAKIEAARMPEDAEQAVTAAAGARSLVTDAVLVAIDTVAPILAKEIEADGVVRALEVARDEKSAAAEDLRRQMAARAELEDRVAELRAPDEEHGDLEQRREALVEQRAAARRDLEAAEKAASVRAELKPALPALEKSVAAARAKLDEVTGRLKAADGYDAEADSIEEPETVIAPAAIPPDAAKMSEADRLIAEADAIEEPGAVEVDPAKQKEVDALDAKATELIDNADAIEIPSELTIAVEESALFVAQQEHEKAKKSPWREVMDIADRLEPRVMIGTDPHKDIDRLRELAVEHGGDVVSLGIAVTEALEALKTANRHRDERTTEIEQARKRQQEMRDEARKLLAQRNAIAHEAVDAAKKATEEARATYREQVKRLRDRAEALRKEARDEAKAANDAARAEYAEAQGTYEAKVIEVAERREELRKAAREIRSEATEAQSKLDRAEALLRAARERLAGVDSVSTNAEEARATIETADREIPKIDSDIKALRAAAALRDEMKSLLEKIDAASALRDTWAAAEWSCQRLREADLAARAGGLQARMRRYLKASGRTEEPYLRAARGVCDFGWRRDGQEIAVEVLSGGETAIFCAALAAAILSLRGPSLRILLVEGAETGIDAESQQLLAVCKEALDAGHIDQAVVATCLPIDAPEAWTTVDLSESATRAGAAA